MALIHHIRGNSNQFNNKYQKDFLKNRFFTFLAENLNKREKISVFPSLIFDAFEFNWDKKIVEFYELKEGSTQTQILTDVKTTMDIVSKDFSKRNKSSCIWYLNVIHQVEIKDPLIDFDFELIKIKDLKKFSGKDIEYEIEDELEKINKYCKLNFGSSIDDLLGVWEEYFSRILKTISYAIATKSLISNNNINVITLKILEINEPFILNSYYFEQWRFFHELYEKNKEIKNDVLKVEDFLKIKYGYYLNDDDLKSFTNFFKYIQSWKSHRNLIFSIFLKDNIDFFYTTFYSFYTKKSFENIEKKIFFKNELDNKDFFKKIIESVF